jgi:hypothetical protein
MSTACSRLQPIQDSPKVVRALKWVLLETALAWEDSEEAQTSWGGQAGVLTTLQLGTADQ